MAHLPEAEAMCRLSEYVPQGQNFHAPIKTTSLLENCHKTLTIMQLKTTLEAKALLRFSLGTSS